jgi:predicted RNase H-like HicB family nuclease
MIHNHNFQVLYQQDQDGFYVAKVPTLPGCHTQGKTIEEAEERIKEAIAVYLESLQADDENLVKQMSNKVFLGSVNI